MNLEDEFGDIVGKARVGMGLTVEKLAGAAGLPAHEISRIESYAVVPDAETVDRIASALGLDAGKLTQIAHGKWAPAHRSANSGCNVRTIHVSFGMYAENAYIAWCPNTRRAAVVDPGGSVGEIAAVLQAEQAGLDLILITHTHADHTAGLEDLLHRYPRATLVTSRADGDLAAARQSLEWMPADDLARVKLGTMSIEALATPGHTTGATCYLVDGACFVGDTLFAGSIGRPASSAAYPAMLSQIRSKLLSLPGGTMLFPGHGPATTVAEELVHNPFF